MKGTKSKPDKFLMELKHFFPHLSYYLPTNELDSNEDLKNWMRNTPDLSYQYATEIEYNLPAPRHQHY